MLVSLTCQGKVVLLPLHQALGFVGEYIVVIVPADADHRGGAEIPLFDDAGFLYVQAGGDLRDQIFALDFHNQYDLLSSAAPGGRSALILI